MASRAVILGCAGPELLPDERAFFRSVKPWGFILFARNVRTPAQVGELAQALRESAGGVDAPVFIDQEGGRVARLRPPHWRAVPPAGIFGELHADDPELAREACTLNALLLADDLRLCGLNADCAPVLDVPVPGSHEIIGDRAFASDPEIVARLGRAMCEGLLSGGVLPVIKHIPGHGRAGADSHLALPVVDASREVLARTDFAPFAALADMPLAMTAHVAFSQIDGDVPASHSRRIISDVIRGEIGFEGALMCDDVGMAALPGSFAERARKAIDAGCDLILHCSGVMQEMEAVVDAVPVLAGRSAERCTRALAHLSGHKAIDREATELRFSQLIGRFRQGSNR